MTDIKTLTLNEIEAALSAGKIFVRSDSGHEWRCRRNGQTVIWESNPGAFKIPIRAENPSIYGDLRYDNLHRFVIREGVKPTIRATGGKIYKFTVQWQGRTFRFERERDAIAWIEANCF